MKPAHYINNVWKEKSIPMRYGKSEIGVFTTLYDGRNKPCGDWSYTQTITEHRKTYRKDGVI